MQIIDLLTLPLGVGLKLPHFIHPIYGQMSYPCPDVSKKLCHLYVSLLVFEMALLRWHKWWWGGGGGGLSKKLVKP